VIIVILIYIFIAILQVPSLIKQKFWKEFIVFSFLYVTAFVLSIMYVLDFDLPSPYRAIRYLIKDILHLNY
jgi:hypothetical protein